MNNKQKIEEIDKIIENIIIGERLTGEPDYKFAIYQIARIVRKK